MKIIDNLSLLTGRALLGLYFIGPGMQKISNYDYMAQYMAKHDVPLISVLLPLTILLQIIGGFALIVGYKAKVAAFILAGLTLVISIFMHNFWNLPEGGNVMHETQNFVKNMAIMAGLLIFSARGAGQFSFDNKNQNQGIKVN